jgi:hypothetical protein
MVRFCEKMATIETWERRRNGTVAVFSWWCQIRPPRGMLRPNLHRYQLLKYFFFGSSSNRSLPVFSFSCVITLFSLSGPLQETLEPSRKIKATPLTDNAVFSDPSRVNISHYPLSARFWCVFSPRAPPSGKRVQHRPWSWHLRPSPGPVSGVEIHGRRVVVVFVDRRLFTRVIKWPTIMTPMHIFMVSARSQSKVMGAPVDTFFKSRTNLWSPSAVKAVMEWFIHFLR